MSRPWVSRTVWPWVSRKELEKAEAEARKYKSNLELLQWWLKEEGVEPPGFSMIMSLMMVSIHASKRKMIIEGIFGQPSSIDAFTKEKTNVE